MNNKCFYLVEGACERQLINALKAEPARLIPGSIIVHNVVQKTIHKAYVASFGRNSFVTMDFDTDIPQTDILKENISLLKKHCAGVRLIYLAQVLNFEDEITRATDVNRQSIDTIFYTFPNSGTKGGFSFPKEFPERAQN